MRPLSAFALVPCASSALAQSRGAHDVETMNRVLAVCARKRNAAKPPLASPQEAELHGALADPVETKLSSALEKDAAHRVRATAATLLARFSSPRAISAWGHASRNDTDPNVKLVAAQSLRKLTPGSPLP